MNSDTTDYVSPIINTKKCEIDRKRFKRKPKYPFQNLGLSPENKQFLTQKLRQDLINMKSKTYINGILDVLPKLTKVGYSDSQILEIVKKFLTRRERENRKVKLTSESLA